MATPHNTVDIRTIRSPKYISPTCISPTCTSTRVGPSTASGAPDDEAVVLLLDKDANSAHARHAQPTTPTNTVLAKLLRRRSARLSETTTGWLVEPDRGIISFGIHSLYCEVSACSARRSSGPLHSFRYGGLSRTGAMPPRGELHVLLVSFWLCSILYIVR